ncbi:unnamed protein product [Polarella glacialis]|uniref:Uncharacterized protein n=1 Tax=Polarella glacialis TaxID=89957 RepID=A0A813I3V6_POLGL|nr:unnamed protein product [Polarella glacialis]
MGCNSDGTYDLSVKSHVKAASVRFARPISAGEKVLYCVDRVRDTWCCATITGKSSDGNYSLTTDTSSDQTHHVKVEYLRRVCNEDSSQGHDECRHNDGDADASWRSGEQGHGDLGDLDAFGASGGDHWDSWGDTTDAWDAWDSSDAWDHGEAERQSNAPRRSVDLQPPQPPWRVVQASQAAVPRSLPGRPKDWQNTIRASEDRRSRSPRSAPGQPAWRKWSSEQW